jgi:hypothetical protein
MENDIEQDYRNLQINSAISLRQLLHAEHLMRQRCYAAYCRAWENESWDFHEAEQRLRRVQERLSDFRAGRVYPTG